MAAFLPCFFLLGCTNSVLFGAGRESHKTQRRKSKSYDFIQMYKEDKAARRTLYGHLLHKGRWRKVNPYKCGLGKEYSNRTQIIE